MPPTTRIAVTVDPGIVALARDGLFMTGMAWARFCSAATKKSKASVHCLVLRRAPFRTLLLFPQLLKQGRRIDRRHVNLTDLRSRTLRTHPVSRSCARHSFSFSSVSCREIKKKL